MQPEQRRGCGKGFELRHPPPGRNTTTQVTDLDFRLVDRSGNPASVPARGIDVKVDIGPLHLSSFLTKASEGTMPVFSLVLKRQGKGSAAAAATQSREAAKLTVSAAGLKQQARLRNCSLIGLLYDVSRALLQASTKAGQKPRTISMLA